MTDMELMGNCSPGGWANQLYVSMKKRGMIANGKEAKKHLNAWLKAFKIATLDKVRKELGDASYLFRKAPPR